ncbi:MAG: outer membrane protein assembly factor BamB family protein [Candidatus Heimdallarchaeota archaeon]
METIIEANENVYCLDHEGSLLWSFPISTGIIDRLTPALADFELDNEVEIVLCAGEIIYCLNQNGTQRWNYNATVERWTGSPVIADIDQDGQLEVVVLADSRVICLDDQGEVEWEYYIEEGYLYRNSPVLADFDGNGQMEIVVMAGVNRTICLDSLGNKIWEIELENLDVHYASSPTIYDLNGDGVLDIILCSRKGLICLEITGTKPVKCPTENRALWRCLKGSNFRTGHMDRDSDFLDDQTETFYGTKVNNPDTDKDTVCDGMEVYAGTDPTKRWSVPLYGLVGSGLLPLLISPLLIAGVTYVLIRWKDRSFKKEEVIEEKEDENNS